MTIYTRSDLKNCIYLDSKNFERLQKGFFWRFIYKNFSNPISDQYEIWRYIKTLRYLEYHTNNNGLFHKLLMLRYYFRLHKLSHKTGFQIPANVLGPGVTIYHWGPIIINSKSKVGRNCTLYPGVLIGWKTINGGCPIIGDNVFIGAGTKIIGKINIGDNVIIGQNCVITKDISNNSIIVAPPTRSI